MFNQNSLKQKQNLANWSHGVNVVLYLLMQTVQHGRQVSLAVL